MSSLPKQGQNGREVQNKKKKRGVEDVCGGSLKGIIQIIGP